jgi:hypothetical protein
MSFTIAGLISSAYTCAHPCSIGLQHHAFDVEILGAVTEELAPELVEIRRPANVLTDGVRGSPFGRFVD